MKKSLFVLVALAVTATAMLALSGTASAAGVTQVSGLGTCPNPGEDHCTNGALLAVADYLINLEGDLEGCVYGGVTAGSATGSGVSKTWSTEIFDGCWNGACGTFDMLGNIQAKEGPAPSASACTRSSRAPARAVSRVSPAASTSETTSRPATRRTRGT